jgi:antitoxin component of RelBE/YafQ-DinJ toxin-antitoxin module
MRYFLQAVEDQTKLPFEQAVNSEAEYEKLKGELEKDGYSNFFLDERWSNLDEMYATLREEGY